MINITGEYTFKQDDKVILKGHNLITLIGESFFMNRWINDEFSPITKILLGKGTARPRKTDTKLSKLSITKDVKTTADLVNRRLTLTADFTASEVLNTTEIGVSNGDILISHDIYEQISEDMLQNDTTSTVHLTYNFNLTTGGLRSSWKPTKDDTSIYYVYEPANVVGVIEASSNKAYSRKGSVEELTGVDGSYYYSVSSKNLYINPFKEEITDDDEIIVQTR